MANPCTEQELKGACWIWPAAKNSDGYGQAWLDGRVQKAHRIVLAAFESPVSEDLHALHHCDTPACVNPFHLYWGTAKDNAADREQRNSWDRSGESNGRAKLTRTHVDDIRRELEAGATVSSVAKRYRVHRRQVGRIRDGERWK